MKSGIKLRLCKFDMSLYLAQNCKTGIMRPDKLPLAQEQLLHPQLSKQPHPDLALMPTKALQISKLRKVTVFVEDLALMTIKVPKLSKLQKGKCYCLLFEFECMKGTSRKVCASEGVLATANTVF